jgi:heat-inducible transcriptional repressor
MLDPRKSAVLRAIVRDYVRTGQPVASKVLAQRYRLKVSAATIRNDMGLLEELGYISQPHTSAGRIPTDQGYRWFVDNWPQPTWPELPSREIRTIRALLEGEFRGLEETLETTSHVLSDVTESIAVVVAPPARKNFIRRIELLPRDDRRATLLLIGDTGIVEQGVVEFTEPRSEDEMNELARTLNVDLEGVAFEDAAAKLTSRERLGIDHRVISDEIERILASKPLERIFRGGTANILSPDKFPDMSVAHEVVEALEEPSTLASLVEAARKAGGMLVFIGREVPVEQMRYCAIVFAPYEARSGGLGTLGVVGPTRIDYPHTISAVQMMARSLSELLASEVL